MSVSKNAVTYYTRATVDVMFPEDKVVCQWCPLLGTERSLERHYCKRTGEIISDPKYIIGGYCPLKFEEGNDEEVPTIEA